MTPRGTACFFVACWSLGVPVLYALILWVAAGGPTKS